MAGTVELFVPELELFLPLIPRIWRDLEDKYKMFGPIALKNDYKFYKKEEYSEWKCQKQECYACKKSTTK